MEQSVLAEKYIGAVALDYDAKKTSKQKWANEQAAMHRLLLELPTGLNLLDVPIGTGRFFDFYRARALTVTGADISEDMLAIARSKAKGFGIAPQLDKTSITELPYADETFDCCVCFRLLNWLEPTDFGRAIHELARVTNRYVIIGVRTSPTGSRLASWFAPLRKPLRRLAGGRHRGGRIVIHSEELLAAALRDSRLTVLSSLPILPKRLGSTYSIILLRKH